MKFRESWRGVGLVAVVTIPSLMATCGKCFWCKNRVKGISPGVPQTRKATEVDPSWGWLDWSGQRGSAKRGHGVCLLPTGLMESGPWVSAG